ncbi:MAG: phage tail protein [Candidatus Bathyarchaeota archaeon]|nr:phage tail protein [Candidatus Bathyarchaeota archaeon]
MSTKKEISNQRKDPFSNCRFRVEIDGIAQAGFSEVIFPESESEVIEFREGTDSLAAVRKQSGLIKNSNLILKWGLTASMELYNWRKLVEQTKLASARRNMVVVLLDEEFIEVARWEFTNAWPCKYKGPDLNAKGNEIAIETLEIVFESMRRVK